MESMILIDSIVPIGSLEPANLLPLIGLLRLIKGIISFSEAMVLLPLIRLGFNGIINAFGRLAID